MSSLRVSSETLGPFLSSFLVLRALLELSLAISFCRMFNADSTQLKGSERMPPRRRELLLDFIMYSLFTRVCAGLAFRLIGCLTLDLAPAKLSTRVSSLPMSRLWLTWGFLDVMAPLSTMEMTLEAYAADRGKYERLV